MSSTLYEGWIRHRRSSPVTNVFRYAVYMSYLDLAEVEGHTEPASSCGAYARWLRGYKREDHFGGPSRPVSECVRDLVDVRLGFRPGGAVCLLTHLRQAGYVMNPVSFFYCWNTLGQTVDAVVAEVHNTPWGETHCYVLDTRGSEGAASRHQFSKQFHVSPFMQLKQEYRWRLSTPGRRLVVQMDNLEESTAIFNATLVMKQTAVTPSALRRIRWRYPMMTYRVIASIYKQALRLWMKRCPHYAHPSKAHQSKQFPESDK